MITVIKGRDDKDQKVAVVVWGRNEGEVFPVVMYGCESWTMKKAGNSRVIQWLECHTSTARGQVQSLAGEYGPTSCAMWPEREAVSHCY